MRTHSDAERRPLKLEADPPTRSDRKDPRVRIGQRNGVFEQREREEEDEGREREREGEERDKVIEIVRNFQRTEEQN